MSYFLEKEFAEEECFWILSYIIEDMMPREYYTNMLALRADIQLVAHVLSFKEPKLMEHFKSLYIDLSLLTVESFLTIYTNTIHPALADVIIDHFFSDGSVVLIKAMIIIIRFFKDNLLEIDNFGRNRLT